MTHAKSPPTTTETSQAQAKARVEVEGSGEAQAGDPVGSVTTAPALKEVWAIPLSHPAGKKGTPHS
jgi:hypothetical protein